MLSAFIGLCGWLCHAFTGQRTRCRNGKHVAQPGRWTPPTTAMVNSTVRRVIWVVKRWLMRDSKGWLWVASATLPDFSTGHPAKRLWRRAKLNSWHSGWICQQIDLAGPNDQPIGSWSISTCAALNLMTFKECGRWPIQSTNTSIHPPSTHCVLFIMHHQLPMINQQPPGESPGGETLQAAGRFGSSRQVGSVCWKMCEPSPRLFDTVDTAYIVMECYVYRGFHTWGIPNSWMLCNGKSQSKMESIGTILRYPGNLHIIVPGSGSSAFVSRCSGTVWTPSPLMAWGSWDDWGSPGEVPGKSRLVEDVDAHLRLKWSNLVVIYHSWLSPPNQPGTNQACWIRSWHYGRPNAASCKRI